MWKYIPSKYNHAADLISKGCNYDDLECIIQGPDILKLPEKDWPTSHNMKYVVENDEELRKGELMVNNVAIFESVMDATKLSSWKRLVRSDNERIQAPDPDEIKGAEVYWVKYVHQNLKIDG